MAAAVAFILATLVISVALAFVAVVLILIAFRIAMAIVLATLATLAMLIAFAIAFSALIVSFAAVGPDDQVTGNGYRRYVGRVGGVAADEQKRRIVGRIGAEIEQVRQVRVAAVLDMGEEIDQSKIGLAPVDSL